MTDKKVVEVDDDFDISVETPLAPGVRYPTAAELKKIQDTIANLDVETLDHYDAKQTP